MVLQRNRTNRIIYIYVYVYAYVYIYICVYIYIYVYICIFLRNFFMQLKFVGQAGRLVTQVEFDVAVLRQNFFSGNVFCS